jgi:signal peptidase II
MEQLDNHNSIHKNKMIAGSVLPAIISFLILVFLDQFTKYLVDHKMALYDAIPVIENVFEIHYIRNPGTAWGLLANRQTLFIICTILVFIIGITIYCRCAKLGKYKDIQALLVMIIAGGMGNFIDRIRYQYVIDFLYFKLINFPVFNVADCYVTVGFILLILVVLFKYKEEDFEDIFKTKR